MSSQGEACRGCCWLREQVHLHCLPVVELRLWGLLTLTSRQRFSTSLGKGVCARVCFRKPVASFILISVLEAGGRNASEKRTEDPDLDAVV